MTGIERLRKLIEDYRAGRECDGFECTELSCGKCMAKNVLKPIADQIEREHAEMVADSPYDALPPEDRETIAWVRYHGGLEAVRKMADIALDVYQRLVDGNAGLEMLETDADTINAMMAEIDEAIVKRGKERMTALALLDESVPRVTYERHILKRQRQIDESHAALRRRNERIEELEHERDELYEMVRSLNAQMDALDRRLMPEGMEWLLEVWPKWSNGEYCKFGDWWKSDKYGESKPNQFRKLSIYTPDQLREWGQDDGESYGYEWDFMRPSDPKYRPDKAEPPAPTDTWERLEEDVAGASCPDVYCANHHIDASDASYEWAMARDIVRRAKALAERGQ